MRCASGRSKLAVRSGIVTIVVAALFLVWTAVIAEFAFMYLVLAALAARRADRLVARSTAPGSEGWSFALGAATIAFAVLALFTALFPDVMPASNDPANSLTIANASSSTYTLTVMSWTALVFLPLILAYQGWTYWIFRKRVTQGTHRGGPALTGDPLPLTP